MSGCLIGSDSIIVENKPSPHSAQRADFIALRRVRALAKAACFNIYTDVRCPFAIVLDFGAMWREIRILTATKSPMSYSEEVQDCGKRYSYQVF